MQRLTISLIAALALISSIGCATHKSIPDDELADIFHDVYLTNAYLNNFPLQLDSIEIYEPILRHYGYTVEDFTYTIGSFSRRKSAQLGNVLQEAETKLRKRTRELDKDITILDTIRDVAIRTFRRTIRQDSLIEAKVLADTQKLHICIEPLSPGNYTVKYNYENREKAGKDPLRGAMYLTANNGMRRSNYMFNLRDKDYVRRSFVVDTNHKQLIIDMRVQPKELYKKGKKRRKAVPDMTIHNLEIEYIPNEDVAIDSLLRKLLDIKIFNDEFFCTTQDSVALGSDSLRID